MSRNGTKLRISKTGQLTNWHKAIRQLPLQRHKTDPITMNDLTITMGNLEERRADPAKPRDETITDEYLRVLATQASRVPLPVFIADLIIASMAAKYYSTLVWGSWIVIITAILVTRWWILTRLPSKSEVSIDVRERLAVSLSLANGLAHGGSGGGSSRGERVHRD